MSPEMRTGADPTMPTSFQDYAAVGGGHILYAHLVSRIRAPCGLLLVCGGSRGCRVILLAVLVNSLAQGCCVVVSLIRAHRTCTSYESY